MVDSMLSSGSVAAIQGRPIAYVDSIRNKTSEHIDTESITDSVSTKMLNSGKFRFVDMTKEKMFANNLTSKITMNLLTKRAQLSLAK